MRKLCLFSGGFALATAGYIWLLHGAPWVLLALLAVLLAVLAFLRTKLTRRLFLCVLGLLVGFVWCRGYEALFLRPLQSYTDRELPVTAQAVSAPRRTSYGYAVDVTLHLGSRSCAAVLYYTEADGAPLPGDALACRAKLTSAQTQLARGNAYVLSRGELLTANCRGTLHVTSCKATLRFVPARFACQLAEALRASFDADTAGFVQALLLGDRAELSYAQKNDLAIAGIYHAVSVSGMHVSILLGIVMLLCGANHKLAALIGLPAAAFFVLMTGAPASAVRAGVMQAIVLCAPLVRRDYDPPTAIAAALLVLLGQNPWAILDAGLQLSFASTAGIVLFCGPMYRAIAKKPRIRRLLRPGTLPAGLLRRMLTALCCTISSMVFALPITALQFGTVSLVAPVVNVLLLWLISLVFSASLLTALLALIFPSAAAVCGWLLGWPVRLIWLVTHGAAKLPFAALYPDNGYLIAAAVCLYGLILLLALLPKRVRPLRTLAAAVLVTALCLGLSGADYRLPDSSFTVLDVGQGQCLVSRIGESISIIDCGGQEDVSGERAARYLLARGIQRADRLILTHFDADHCNGAVQLLRRVRIDTIYLPQLSPQSPLRAQIVLAALECGTQVRFVREDLTVPLESGSVRLFAPLGDPEEENAGVCVLAQSEKYDILVTGDCSTLAEYRLLSTHTLPRLTALIAGHHGAANSTSDALLQALRPQTVCISVGAQNPFGHPADETLRRIAALGAAVYRTDTCGTITIRG